MSAKANMLVKMPAAKTSKAVSIAGRGNASRPWNSPLGHLMLFQNRIGNRAIQRFCNKTVIQPDLTVRRVEAEEESKAGTVMRRPEKGANEAPLAQALEQAERMKKQWTAPQEAGAESAGAPAAEEGKTTVSPALGPLPEQVEELQTQSAAPPQAMGGESPEQSEEPVQAKREDQSENTAAGNFESRLSASKDGGSPLLKETRLFMEPRFNADFSGVRVHTDAGAVQMNREISAQAFTLGRDVYFNTGRYNPSSREGQRLLAHELTHVIQQDGLETAQPALIQRQPAKGDWVKDEDGALYYGTEDEAIKRRDVLQKKEEWSEFRIVEFKIKGKTYWRVEMRGSLKTPTPAISPAESIEDLLTRIILLIWELIKQIIEAIQKGMQEQAKKALETLEALRKIAEKVDEAVARIWSHLPSPFKEVFEKLWKLLKEFLKESYDLLKKELKALAGKPNKSVCLTFDDGPADGTQEVLDVLKAKDAPATFFLSALARGGKPDDQRKLVEQMLGDSRFQVANHTYTHSPTTRGGYKTAYGDLSDAAKEKKFKENFTKNQDYFNALFTGTTASFPTFNLARLPGDGRLVKSGGKEVYVQAVDKMGMAHVGWHAEFGPNSFVGARKGTESDWQGIKGVALDPKGGPRDKGIVLMHDHHWKGGDKTKLEQVLDKLSGNSYAFNALDKSGKCP